METKPNALLEETVSFVKKELSGEIEQIAVERAVLGLFFTGVKLSTGQGGCCFTPVKEMPQAVCCPSSAKAMPLSGKLSGRPVLAYLDDIFTDNPLRNALGIAALNALSALCWEKNPPTAYAIQKGVDAFDSIDISQYKKTVVVGALVPMMKQLIRAEADFIVLEMDVRTLKGKELEHYAPPAQADQFIPSADLLVITGVTILNNTLRDLLRMAKKGAEIVVTGPTASMLPDVFFREGVTTLGGILVTKPDELLDVIAEAGSGYHFFGKSAERTVIRRG